MSSSSSILLAGHLVRKIDAGSDPVHTSDGSAIICVAFHSSTVSEW